jgi:hypothetical protein
MTIISDRITIYDRAGGSETLRADQAHYRVHLHPDEWSLTPPAPLNWQYEIPKYRCTRALLPAEKARFRFETPFTEMAMDTWQYGERHYEAGEEVTTTAWPHTSMQGLNFSAQQVLAFFKAEMKSRLTKSPWFDGQVRLSNGLTNAPAVFDVRPPQIKPMNLRPVA